MNQYQKAKARKIVALLMQAQEDSTLNRHQLAKCVALMPSRDWQTVCFTAGVPVADLDAKAAVLALLRGQVPHVVGSRQHR